MPEKQKFQDRNIKYLTYYQYNLLLTFDSLRYKTLIYQSGKTYISQINKTNVAYITLLENKQKNKVETLKSEQLILEYLDTKETESSFNRELGTNKYFFVMVRSSELQLRNLLNLKIK